MTTKITADVARILFEHLISSMFWDLAFMQKNFPWMVQSDDGKLVLSSASTALTKWRMVHGCTFF